MNEAAEVLFQAGRKAWMHNEVPEAIATLRQALSLAPSNAAIRAALGAALLKGGNLQEGFPLFDAWRQLRPSAPALPFPRWQGQEVRGKRLLIWGEHGLGDQIQWARFAVLLRSAGAEVSWLCPRSLATLLADLGITPLPMDESARLDGFDLYCPSSALPLGFALSVDSLDGSPYLMMPPAVSQGSRVGVMTSGNIDNVAGRPRGLPAHQAERLRSLKSAIDLNPSVTGVKDFRETAAIISGLDFVITVDTSVAHLAGGLGVPAIVLLPYVADWRWFMDRNDSPWYSSIQLVRQSASLGWEDVVDAAISAYSDRIR